MQNSALSQEDATMLGEVALLLRKEHENLEARLEMRWAWQENLLQQLSQYLAHHFEGHGACRIAPFSQNDAFPDEAQDDCLDRFEAKAWTNVVPAIEKNTENLKQDKTDDLAETRKKYGSMESLASDAGMMDQCRRSKLVVTKTHGSMEYLPSNGDMMNQGRHSNLGGTKMYGSMESLASNGELTGRRGKRVDRKKHGSMESLTSEEGGRRHLSETHHLNREVAVKLGTTSTERVVRDFEDQFRRLAVDEQTLTFSRMMAVISEHEELLSEEHVVNVVYTLLSSCPGMDRMSNSQPIQSTASGIHSNRSVRLAPMSPGDAIVLDEDAFMHLLLVDAEEVPAEIENDLLLIRKAFESDRLDRQDRLNIIAMDRSKHKGSYEDMPIAADLIGAGVILLNSLAMGLGSDVEAEHYLWRIVEYCFLAFFIVEVLWHVSRQGLRKFFFGRDWRWNFFDFVLVGLAVIDAILSELSATPGSGGPVQILSTAMRLARLSRLIRLLRFKVFGELKQMIYGVLAGIRVLAWANFLLLVFIYMVSVLFRQTIGQDSDSLHANSFRDIPWTMFTLFRCFTDGCTASDGTPLQVYLYERYGPVFALTYVFVFLFVSIGIFNLIMATFVENVMTVSAVRKQVERAINAGKLKIKLTKTIVEFWNSNQKTLKEMKTFGAKLSQELVERDMMSRLEDVRVTRDMLQLWMCHPDMISILGELEIVNADHSRLFDALDCDLSGELEGSELVEGLMSLRGPTEKIDVVSTLLGVKYMTAMLQKLEAEILEPIEDDGRRGALYQRESEPQTEGSGIWSSLGDHCLSVRLSELPGCLNNFPQMIT